MQGQFVTAARRLGGAAPASSELDVRLLRGSGTADAVRGGPLRRNADGEFVGRPEEYPNCDPRFGSQVGRVEV